MRTAGLILAGGAGSRLGGVIKAELRIGGETLLSRSIRSLGNCSPILVAHGGVAPERLAVPGIALVADGPSPPEGPLAGLLAALAFLETNAPDTEAVLTVAVDTPFFPADFAAQSLPKLTTGAPAVLAAYGGQAYPTNGLWSLPALRGAQASFHKSLFRLAEAVGAANLDWADFSPHNPFSNINTVADLLEAQRLAGIFAKDAADGKFVLGKAI